MKTYCLGYTHDKCDTCQHEKNWDILNQMPDVLRKAMQKDMKNINVDKCRITKMGEYVDSTKGDVA